VVSAQALEEDGKGRVLVVDAGASMRCAVLGDNLAAMGAKNGWSVLLPHSETVTKALTRPLRQNFNGRSQ
jgi:hypothetical protein